MKPVSLAAFPATPDGHHSYGGGLLEHTVGVATLCRETCSYSEVALHVEEGRTRDVRLPVGTEPEARIVQGPAAVDEAVFHL